MTQQERFGKRLRQLRREKSAREERDVEQAEVAEAIGDTQPNVARWEKGRIPKDDATLRRLAEYYGVNVGWLRLGEGSREPEHQANHRTTKTRERTEATRPASVPKRRTGS